MSHIVYIGMCLYSVSDQAQFATPTLQTQMASRKTKACKSAHAGTKCSGHAQSNTWGIELPAPLKAIVEGWGREMIAGLAAVRQRKFPNAPPASLSRPWQVGTDFSGVEAPIWALRELAIPFQHVFACDNAPAAQAMIRANTMPDGPLFGDVLNRDAASVPDCSLYIAGFPCQPFSSLNNHTKLLADKNATPFHATVRFLADKQPNVIILENVMGLARCMLRVLRALKAALPNHHIIKLTLNPERLGEPSSRPRFYFILVCRGIAIEGDSQRIVALAQEMATAMEKPLLRDVSAQVLPTSHHYVQRQTAALMKKFRARGFVMSPSHTSRLGASNPKVLSCDQMFLSNRRERAVWEYWRNSTSDGLTADLSQSRDRAKRRNGVVPTITTRSKICVCHGSLARTLFPIDLLLLQGFPVHRMRFPYSLSARDLAKLAGNTMHLKCVGLALAIGILLTRADLGRQPAKRADPVQNLRGGLTPEARPRQCLKRGLARAAPTRGKTPRHDLAAKPSAVRRRLTVGPSASRGSAPSLNELFGA